MNITRPMLFYDLFLTVMTAKNMDANLAVTS